MKLNGPLVAPAYTSITNHALTPDASLVLYRADLEVDERLELYASPLDGSGAVRRVSAPMTNPEGDVWSFAIAPGAATHVVYKANAVQSAQLFSARIDGIVEPVPLTDSAAGVLDYRISADGLQIAYVAYQTSPGPWELFRVPIDGHSSPTRLSGPLVDGGDVSNEGFALTFDGSRVVYVADQDTDEVFELYSSDGVLPPVKLNAPLVSGGDVGGGRPWLAITPDDERVVYVADQEVDERRQLYSVPIDGSQPPVRLDPALPGENVASFLVSPDGRWVAFELDQALYTVPIDDGTSASRIASYLSDRSYGRQYAFDSGSTRVVYRARQAGVDQLWSAPIDGAGPSVLLNPPLSGGGVYDFSLDPLEERVAFDFQPLNESPDLLASVPIDGSAPAVLLNAPEWFDASVREFAWCGERILYVSDQSSWQDFELYSSPGDGSASPVRVSGPTVPGGDVAGFLSSDDAAQVLYHADQERDSVMELFAAPADGSAAARKVTPMLPSGPPAGDVSNAYAITPDAARVVYIADQDVDGLFEAYSVPTDASSAPVKLSAGEVCSIAVTPGANRVVHVRVAEGAEQLELQLFVGPADGSTPATRRASLLYPPGFNSAPLSVSPDGRYALCQVLWFSYPSMFREPLYSVPLDGATAAHGLTPAGVSQFAVDPLSSRVVFRHADQLFSVPIDGSAAAVTLNGSLVPGGSVTTFLITPDGQRVVYTADQRVDERRELFSVPIDGSAAALVLSGPASGAGVGNFAVSADSTRVAYTMQTALGTGLFSRTVDRTEPLVILAPLQDLSSPVKVSATGRAVFQDGDLLRSVRVDGSSPAIDLASSSNPEFKLSPDGQWAVSRGTIGFFSVPTDGSSPWIPLGVPPGILRYEITPDSNAVVFQGHELFQAAIDGSPPAVRLNGALVERGDVNSFQIASDSRTVVYRADQMVDEAYELFATRFRRWIATMPAPSRSATVWQD